MRCNVKTVLVTGSSRGIGLAIAEKFALNGYKVVLNCIKNDVLMNEQVLRLSKFNKNIIGLKADVSDYESVVSLQQRISEKFGNVDILINNAGIAYAGLFSLMKPEEWRRLTEVNFYSVLNCCNVFSEDMISKKSGVIINISSIWGQQGASCEVVYSATKGAVDSFTKALAQELAPSNVRVNAVSFGAIDTEMNDNLSLEEKLEFAEEIPLKRFGKVSEAAAAAYFLAQDESAYITGHILTVSGGV